MAQDDSLTLPPITIALGIPHTPWREERVASLDRLVDALTPIPSWVVAHCIFADRQPNHEWSEAMWEWAAEQTGATHFLTLQDDVITPPGPRFWNALRAMLAAVSDQVIGLEAAHRVAPAIAEERERWYTTADGLIGVGYAMPRHLLLEFLDWRRQQLKARAKEVVSEDTLVGLWCLSTGRKIFHPVPTIIDHDTSLPSTYGNDTHGSRRPLVTWSHPSLVGQGPVELLEQYDFWLQRGRVRHLGRFYEATPRLATEWVIDFDEAAYARAMRDDGRETINELGRARMQRLPPPKHRIMMAMPTRGGVCPHTALTIANLASVRDVDVDVRFALDRFNIRQTDLVRARSVFVRMFLEETQATHLLFVDSDISFDTRLLLGMLQGGEDFVAAPYPRREGIDFERARAAPPGLGEAAAYRYAFHPLERFEPRPNGLVEVKHMPLGCTLLSRTCLSAMVERYRSELSFMDRTLGPTSPIRTVALFQLLLEDGELMSEDFSFCERWRRMGGKVWGYFGPGSPVTHHGEHAYRGRIEAFNLRHGA